MTNTWLDITRQGEVDGRTIYISGWGGWGTSVTLDHPIIKLRITDDPKEIVSLAKSTHCFVTQNNEFRIRIMRVGRGVYVTKKLRNGFVVLREDGEFVPVASLHERATFPSMEDAILYLDKIDQ